MKQRSRRLALSVVVFAVMLITLAVVRYCSHPSASTSVEAHQPVPFHSATPSDSGVQPTRDELRPPLPAPTGSSSDQRNGFGNAQKSTKGAPKISGYSPHELAERLVKGIGMNDVLDDDLKRVLTDKLNATDELLKQATKEFNRISKREVDRKLDAGSYFQDGDTARPTQGIALSSTKWKDDKIVHVFIMKGEALDLEDAIEKVERLRTRRIEDVLQAFRDAGIDTEVPPQ